VPFLVRFFQFQSRVALGLFWGHSLSNGSLRKNTQKRTLFHSLALRGDDRASKSSFECALFKGCSAQKRSTHTTQMNVLSTHAVALHGMNARESQRTPTSASTSSLIARKNTTRSHNNTKKNINAARHRRQRSIIIRYARDNNWKDVRRFLTAPSSKDDDGLWVYDVNDSLWRLELLSSFSSWSSFRVVLHHRRRLVLPRGKAAAASAREESCFPCSFSRG
jgi:hypothetical protein